MNLNNKKRAFTLIELLIVIAIIGILFIVLVSRVDFATDKAKATGVQTDFRSFQVALDQVAKENAGFNIFGWDTGDANGDHIRNSYDHGDTNKNGIEDTGETFIGRKEYGEDWTTIYTMINPKVGMENDDSAFVALEAAINANLDPKLHITITPDVEGGVLTGNATITMANQAHDPWKNEYHGVFITNAARDNGADRGAIIIYSNGANGKWGSAHDIANGVVSVTVPNNNVAGQDDYSLVSCYTYVNGYGEVKNMTTGFSTNQGFLNGGAGSNVGTNNGGAGNEPVEGVTYNVSFTIGVTTYSYDLDSGSTLADMLDKAVPSVGERYYYDEYLASDMDTNFVFLDENNRLVNIKETRIQDGKTYRAVPYSQTLSAENSDVDFATGYESGYYRMLYVDLTEFSYIANMDWNDVLPVFYVAGDTYEDIACASDFYIYCFTNVSDRYEYSVINNNVLDTSDAGYSITTFVSLVKGNRYVDFRNTPTNNETVKLAYHWEAAYLEYASAVNVITDKTVNSSVSSTFRYGEYYKEADSNTFIMFEDNRVTVDTETMELVTMPGMPRCRLIMEDDVVVGVFVVSTDGTNVMLWVEDQVTYFYITNK